MKASVMSDGIQALWACALALGFADAEEIEIGPSAEVPDRWSVSMTRYSEEDERGNGPNSLWVFGDGSTPEEAVGDLLRQLTDELRASQKSIADAMAIFDKACAWDDLRVRFVSTSSHQSGGES